MSFGKCRQTIPPDSPSLRVCNTFKISRYAPGNMTERHYDSCTKYFVWLIDFLIVSAIHRVWKPNLPTGKFP